MSGRAIIMAAILPALTACPPTRQPRASMTRYKLGHDYFVRARKAKAPGVRDRYVNISLVELRKALKLDDQNYHAHFLVAMIYLHKGQTAQAEGEVQQCLIGGAKLEQKKEVDALMRKAEQHLNRAFGLRGKKHSGLALNLSTLHLYFNRPDQAIALAQKALSDIAYRTPYLARNNIGRAHFQRGRHLKALKNIKQAVFSQPNFCPGYYWLGRVHLARKEWEVAVQSFEKSLSCCRKIKVPPIQEALLHLGLAELGRGKKERADVAFKACQAAAPRGCVAAKCSARLRRGEK